jgi:hypothetical protein
MTNSPPDGIFDLAARLGLTVPDAYRAGVKDALALVMEQAALVMAAAAPDAADAGLDFVP